jgi:hypothetical protein
MYISNVVPQQDNQNMLRLPMMEENLNSNDNYII